MPKARSEAQRKAAGAALSAKRRKQKVSRLKGASRSMYESMSQSELRELARTSSGSKKRKKKSSS